ncbi:MULTISPECIES: hypothetical protein [Pirellulaceae]|uniref:hypothetical protein n=1 Tax=Pirellulaceae TaxID=2691357 RepID=UPI0011B0E52D|nr:MULTISPECIES: hypothetical protein [Pirellulaceae]
MPISQNTTFAGPEAESKGQRIRGRSIARLLAADFRETGLEVSELECWRDAGWIFTVRSDTSTLEVIVLADHVDESRWILQISPSYRPGFLTRWFGRTASATPQKVFQAAVRCHETLATHGYLEFQWCWDDFAQGEQCSPEPPRPA